MSVLHDEAAVPAGDVAVAALAWRYRGALRVTAIAKATFAFAEDAEMTRTSAQPVLRTQVHHGGNPARSVRLTTDLAPYLHRADVLLTGHAYPPPGAVVETMTVRFGIFGAAGPVLDKSVLVREKGGISKVPLAYERAYGGLGWADNPFGVGVPAGSGEPALLDPADARLVAGFGPIGHALLARKRLLGALPRRAVEPPGIFSLPDDFAWDYFQAAPADQQVGFLRGDEWIVIDGIHPTRARVRMRLPAARAVGHIHGLGPWGVVEGQPLALHADTLRIDGDEERCTLTFRATFPVADEASLPSLRIALGVQLHGQPIPWPAPASFVAQAPGPARHAHATMALSLADFEPFDGKVLDGILTFDPTPRDEEAEKALLATAAGSVEPPAGPVLPFHGSISSTSPLRQQERARPRATDEWSGTVMQTEEEEERATHRAVLPFGERPSIPPPSAAPPSIPPPSFPHPAAAPSFAVPPAPATPPAPAPAAPVVEKPAAAVEKRAVWAPAAAAAAPAPPPPPPPAPAGQPAVSPALKKGLYGRFGGKR